MEAKCERQTSGRHYEPSEQKQQKGRVVASELVLRLLSVLKIAISVGEVK